MGKFKFITTPIEGVVIVEPTVFGDSRGYFMETYNKEEFEAAGIKCSFVQDNESLSRKGILRGLHMQRRFPQAKLVRVVSGEVFDVCVDARPQSPTFGKWYGVILSEENRRQFFIPRGFLHGFLVLSETVVFAYKCDDFYRPDDEAGLIWNDLEIGIEWPLEGIDRPLLSGKDARYGGWDAFMGCLQRELMINR